MQPVEENTALMEDIARDTPEVIREEMPNGAVIFYRDRDHSYWRDCDSKGQVSGRVRSSSDVAKCDGETNKDGLIDWGVRLEKQGVAWRDDRNERGDVGQATHDYLEATANGFDLAPTSPQQEAVALWWASRQPQALQVEQMIYSVEHNFAGRFDLFVGRHTGVKQLWDCKSGSVRNAAWPHDRGRPALPRRLPALPRRPRRRPPLRLR
jgi:hypothetical protein